MKDRLLFLFIFLSSSSTNAQTFTRAELPTILITPWEMTFGPDGYLWITEANGKVSRVHPTTGDKTFIYVATDYFGGSPLETLPACFNPPIGAGTLGLTLHPDFLTPENAFIYFVYSYNYGTVSIPQTHFKIKRLLWDATSNLVVHDTDIVTGITSGYDHLGGRLLAIEQDGIPYLFLSVGDHGLSETNSPDCYSDQSENPNNLAQDPYSQNGKIHRFNMDGSIPVDNPIAGNSFYTRGHRNPQGLMFNPNLNLLYDIEHSDRTDDEINVLHKGMNYGWKNVRGYHDGHFIGELDYVSNYLPHSAIPNDSLIEAFYAWCNEPMSLSGSYVDWCTVAPSDGIYYDNTAIPTWYNSLLVVTLKDGVTTDREVYQFKLEYNGQLAPSTAENPNPKKYFGEDQSLNGRLRDIAISPDGTKIYLINNGGASTDKITFYTLNTNSVTPFDFDGCVKIYPNPTTDNLAIIGLDQFESIQEIKITNSLGEIVVRYSGSKSYLELENLQSGVYFLTITDLKGSCSTKFIKR